MAEPEQPVGRLLDMVSHHLHQGSAGNGRLRPMAKTVGHRQEPACCRFGDKMAVAAVFLAREGPRGDVPFQLPVFAAGGVHHKLSHLTIVTVVPLPTSETI
ncbi:MAG: hypothetical protein ACD_75C02520G0003 [uncultured bacterium]|nr:MAG: hypothetical protein ACD_75C02520G0003 [uncultured bacterium]